jgi:hypothetical protein
MESFAEDFCHVSVPRYEEPASVLDEICFGTFDTVSRPWSGTSSKRVNISAGLSSLDNLQGIEIL